MEKSSNPEYRPRNYREVRTLCRKVGLCVALMIVFVFAIVVGTLGMHGSKEELWEVPDAAYLEDYNVYNLSRGEKNDQIRLGYEIFRQTSRYLGPDQSEAGNVYAGNRLACANCHLDAGTRPFAGPLIGVVRRFPQYRGREDKMGTIEERINGCMERSMNGRMMPEDSPEMKAMIAYLEWLGRFTPEDGVIAGRGFMKLEIPQRPVNLDNGREVFRQHCMMCHGANGRGREADNGIGYLYPPLWGEGSYNNGAGMTRVLTAASFIKGNMPYGTRFDNPVLTDEQAYDVAGYINVQIRPAKTNLAVDFPDKTKKPVSTPYGPWTDPFSPEQHQLGPFQPIMEYYKRTYNLEKTK